MLLFVRLLLIRPVNARIDDFFRRHPNGRRILGSITWLSADRLLRLAVGVVVGALVARYLGPAQFGIISTAWALFSLASPLVSGFDKIIVRELVVGEVSQESILGATLFYKTVTGILAYGGLVAYAVLVFDDAGSDAGQRQLLIVTLIIGVQIITQSLDIYALWFESRILSKYVAWCSCAAVVLSGAAKLIAIGLEAGLYAFAALTVIEMLVTRLLVAAIYRRKRESAAPWRLCLDVLRRLVVQSWPLVLSGFAAAVYLSIDVVMLERMRGAAEAGIYGAASRVSTILYFLPAVVCTSVMPTLVKSRQADRLTFNNWMQHLYNLMSLMAYLVIVGGSIAAPFFIRLLFGREFFAAVPVFLVHVWACLPVFLGAARDRYVIVEGFLRFALLSSLLGAAVNIGLNRVLIPRYGAMGAAIATLISFSVGLIFSSLLYARTFRTGLMQLRAMILPSPLGLFRNH